MRKLFLIFPLVFIMSCDMSIKEIMNLDIPFSCKMTITCWKTFSKGDKSACEKFAERCKDEYPKYKKQ